MAMPSEKLAQPLELLRKAINGERRSRDPRARPAAHAPRVAPGQRISPTSHKGLVRAEPPGRGEGRENHMVRVGPGCSAALNLQPNVRPSKR
jgi:hypothetical protein